MQDSDFPAPLRLLRQIGYYPSYSILRDKVKHLPEGLTNLYQLAVTADDYFIEHPEEESLEYDLLVNLIQPLSQNGGSKRSKRSKRTKRSKRSKRSKFL